MPPSDLRPWFEALTARLEKNDHTGAIEFLVERSAELLAVPGGPQALVAFLAESKAHQAPFDPWTLLGAADLEALCQWSSEPPETPLRHALGAFCRLELDRALETGACSVCLHPAGPEAEPFHRLARGCHHVAAGRFVEAVAELDALFEDPSVEAPLLRVVAGIVGARAVLRMGDAHEGRRRFAALRSLTSPGSGLCSLVEVHELRAMLSGGDELEQVRTRAEQLASGEQAAHVRVLARRLRAFADVLLGHPPSRASFEAGAEAHLDGAEVAVLAGHTVAVAPLLAVASSCARDGRHYLEARARILAGIASFAEGTAAARRRAEKELALARRLCDDRGYQHLAARCDLVEALAADRSRDPTAHERRLETVLETSTTVTILERLAEAALHRRPLDQLHAGDRQLLDLLGFASLPAFSVDDGTGARLVGSLDLERWQGRADLVVDLDRGELVARNTVVRGQARIVSLLAHLVSAGTRAVEADELFRGVWNARTYAPLRHRNAVYLAIARTRRILSPLLGEAPIVRHPNGWRLREDLYAIVVRAMAPLPTATARSSGT
ncbi:MAG: hypothetical protein JNL79_04270 [Myxococcales bacterium]|nr:hypothetical protein [Myxococcales bacterium]